jgi:ferredoxin-NADP reductase
LGGLSWRPATVVAIHDETASARTLTLDVEGWPGHQPGQHVDLLLRAPDGYTAVRPYSIATATDGRRIDVTVEHVDGGEVSSYLVRGSRPGTQVDVRGPLGGWFVWDRHDPGPVQLVAGGVGVSPLMAMVRAHEQVAGGSPMHLLYSTRAPESVLYRTELARLRADPDAATAVAILFTRLAPAGDRPAGRLSAADLAACALAPSPQTRCFVCGPTGFVEAGIGLLIHAGFQGTNIRAERFG